MSNDQVPVRSRRALIVESGLNDGLALPAVLLFASLATQAMNRDAIDWILFGAIQLVLGPLVGAILGFTHLGILVEAAYSLKAGVKTQGFAASRVLEAVVVLAQADGADDASLVAYVSPGGGGGRAAPQRLRPAMCA